MAWLPECCLGCFLEWVRLLGTPFHSSIRQLLQEPAHAPGSVIFLLQASRMCSFQHSPSMHKPFSRGCWWHTSSCAACAQLNPGRVVPVRVTGWGVEFWQGGVFIGYVCLGARCLLLWYMCLHGGADVLTENTARHRQQSMQCLLCDVKRMHMMITSLLCERPEPCLHDIAVC